MKSINITNTIKVIGVGGSGSHTINYMFGQGKHDVSFALCNTDKELLSFLPVQEKILLPNLGCCLPISKKYMEDDTKSLDEIRSLFNNNVKIAFIVTGMGGYVGTIVAPLIANIAKGMGILTVGIVTMPFLFEGKKRIERALNGIDEMDKNADALLIVNNEHLLHIYENLNLVDAFSELDKILVDLIEAIIEVLKSNNEEQCMKQSFIDSINTIDSPFLDEKSKIRKIRIV